MAFGDIKEIVPSNGNGLSDTDVSITFTAARAENDLIVLAPYAGAASFAAIADFDKEITYTDAVNTHEGAAYSKLAGPAEGATFTAVASSAVIERVMVGILVEGPFGVIEDSQLGDAETGSGSIEAPKGQSVTTTTADAFLIAVGWNNGGGASTITSASMNGGLANGFTFGDIAIRNELSVCMATRLLTSAATITETKIELSPNQAQERNRGALLAFPQAGSGGGPSAGATVIPKYYRQLMAG